MTESRFLSIIKKLGALYMRLEGAALTVITASLFSKAISAGIETMGRYFKYSLFIRSADMPGLEPVFARSAAVSFGAGLTDRLRGKIASAYFDSDVVLLFRDTSRSTLFKPVKSIGICAMSLAALDIAGSLIITDRITFRNIAPSLLLFCFGIACLRCETDWQTLKENSFFFKKVLR